MRTRLVGYAMMVLTLPGCATMANRGSIRTMETPQGACSVVSRHACGDCRIQCAAGGFEQPPIAGRRVGCEPPRRAAIDWTGPGLRAGL